MGDANGKLAIYQRLVQVNSLFAKLFVFLGECFSFLSFYFLPFFVFLSFLLFNILLLKKLINNLINNYICYIYKEI